MALTYVCSRLLALAERNGDLDAKLVRDFWRSESKPGEYLKRKADIKARLGTAHWAALHRATRYAEATKEQRYHAIYWSLQSRRFSLGIQAVK